jgi:hypothetical protein
LKRRNSQCYEALGADHDWSAGSGGVDTEKETKQMKKQILLRMGLAITLAPVCGYAVDGQVLINQSTVNASGGFPYRITQPGSYKLSGNLIPPVDQSAIVISANNVTLDLNGFHVQCSVDGSVVAEDPFSGWGCISELENAVHHITIRNGTVTATGSAPPQRGVFIAGVNFQISDRITAEYLQIEVNVTGFLPPWTLSFGANSIIRHNILSGATIIEVCPSLIEGNTNTDASSAQVAAGFCVLVNNIGAF